MENDPSGPALFSGLRTDSPHAFVRSGTIAELHSDFNQTGQVDFSADERAARTQRPGSILLPAFDPDFVGDDENFYTDALTPVHVRPSGQQNTLPDASLELACVHSNDRDRVAVYTQEGDFVYGGYPLNISESVPPDPDADSVRIQGPAGEAFLMHATTLAGDPRRPGSVDQPPPQSPENTPADIKSGEVWLRLGLSQDEEPPSKQRRTESPGDDDVALFQIAPLLLQSNIARTRRLYVVSAKKTHNFMYDVMEACWAALGPDEPFNRDFAREFRSSTPGGLGTSHTVTSGKCLLSPNKMYLIDGGRYKEDDGNPDLWIQDQMATGYCSAPGDRSPLNVVLHYKRTAGALHQFVREEMDNANDRMVVFNGLFDTEPEQGMLDYGGNVAVSPPVNTGTTAETTREAGPPVPEHPPAPHGKIVLGDCKNPAREEPQHGSEEEEKPGSSAEEEPGSSAEESESDGGPAGSSCVNDDTRTFLQAQEVQPIVPIDTSWLETGHVDEIMTFVPAPHSRNERPARLAMARPDVMERLFTQTIQKASVEEGRTHAHRGRHRKRSSLLQQILDDPSPEVHNEFAGSYDETSVEALLAPDIAAQNQEICDKFLRPIEDRLRHCTRLTRPDDVIPLPVYFNVRGGTEWGKKVASARMPNLVNMQVLNKKRSAHLIVARPCGPRLPPGAAKTVVRTVLNEMGRDDTPVCHPQNENDNPSGFPFWVWPTLSVRTLALFFTRKKPNETFLTANERKQLIDVIAQRAEFSTLPAGLQQAVQNTQATILNANGGSEKTIRDAEGNPVHLVRDGHFTSWHRLFIPEDTVDVIEAYTQSVLEKIGCTVHFVDAWHYHTAGGGVHCGTNVLPEIPKDRQSWWHNYSGLADANTDYDPTNTIHNS